MKSFDPKYLNTTSENPDARCRWQDIVTRQGKFFFYKRPGQRVLMNAMGHLLVRPAFTELSLRQKSSTASMADHMLLRYRNSFASVCLAQLENKGFEDGVQVRFRALQYVCSVELCFISTSGGR